MGKKILAILLCIVLTGCTKSSQAMQERLDQEIATVSALPIPSASIENHSILIIQSRRLDIIVQLDVK